MILKENENNIRNVMLVILSMDLASFQYISIGVKKLKISDKGVCNQFCGFYSFLDKRCTGNFSVFGSEDGIGSGFWVGLDELVGLPQGKAGWTSRIQDSQLNFSVFVNGK